MHQWLPLRALRAPAFLSIFFSLAAQPACADGSVSSLHIGYGARDQYEFARFQM
jgi:hypothetical protein